MNPTWPSVDAFYDEDERRARSPEIDYGVWWRGSFYHPTYRLSHVEATGEIIMVRNTSDAEQRSVELIGWARDRDHAEKALKGWADKCGELRSYFWARSRFRDVPGRAVTDELREEAGANMGTLF